MQTCQIERINRDWLKEPLGVLVKDVFLEAKRKLISDLELYSKHGVLVSDKDPILFLGSFFACISYGVPAFLGSSSWGEKEMREVYEVASPFKLFSENKDLSIRQNLRNYAGLMMIPTGGSGGRVKFSMHAWENLVNSATSTIEYFRSKPMNFLCCLPLHHVSGLMQAIRALVSGGCLQFCKRLFIGGSFVRKSFKEGFLSVVNSQLRSVIEEKNAVSWLKSFEGIFLGGGPPNGPLMERLSKEKVPVYLTYGSTETCSMVTLQNKKDFFNQEYSSGKNLNHSKISINKDGLIVVESNSLYRGYFPNMPKLINEWVSSDKGQIDEAGRLFVEGRADRVIISGGEKVFPQEVESLIQSSGQVNDVVVLGESDERWGERVVAICVPRESFDEERLLQYLKDRIVYYKVPKRLILATTLPFREVGKVDYMRAKEMLEESMNVGII